MAYTKTVWENAPSTNTPINATRLNNIEDGIETLDLGKAPMTSPTFATSITGSYLTPSEMLITDANKKIISAPVATYPSLTELSYVKGLTSSAQTQLTSALGGTLKSIVKEYTRDGTAASGDVSYTGVGFTPTSMRCIMTVNGTLYHSDGFSDSSKNSFGNTQTSSTTYYANNVFASYTDQNNWGQYCTVKSYDADGFTLTWTKAGTVPANTMQLKVICYR